MAIAFANLGASVNPDINSGSDATSYSNSSWTPPTDGLIVAFVIAKRAAALDTPTMSGNSLTWTQIGSTLNCGGNNHGLSLFAADASGSSAGATTVSFGGNTQLHCSASFFHATGVDLSGGVAAAFVQTVTATGSGTTGTVTLSAAANSNNRPIAGFFHATNEAKTPRTNWTELDDLAGTSGTRNLETQYRADAFETTASATWATSDNWGGIAAELKAASTSVLSLQVNASGNDAQELIGTVTTNDTTLWAASTTSGWVGLRFLNVTIPQGATINSATLYVYVNALSDEQDAPVLDIYGEDADNAAIFTTAASSISSRARTTATVNWTEGIGAIGFRPAPDIASLVQEVVDRGGWASGNALVVLFDGGSSGGFTIRAYDSLPAEAAKLDIDWTIAGTLAKTLGTLTLSSAGAVAVAGALTRTLGALTASGAGTVEITGALDKTLGALTSTSAGAVAITGSLAKTLGDLILVSFGGGDLLGSLDKALGALTLSSAGTVEITGALDKTLGALTVSSAGLVVEYRTYIITDSLALNDSGDTGPAIIAPIFVSTDSLALTETIIAPLIIQTDTLTLTDTPVVTVAPIVITDTLTFDELLDVTGVPVTPPATAATGGLDANHVLRLLYGNDKRNPVRTLDIAQSGLGHILLKSGGFAPGAGELNELWSGESIRFDGQNKLAESRKNSSLSITYDLSSGSMAGLSAVQREINRFFLEAKVQQVRRQGEKIWLEYRWADNLNSLPTPTFGQLSGYWEVYAAKSPRWPDDLHSGALVAGEIDGVTCDLTCSPAPEGLKQRAANAMGAVSLSPHGVLIASGSSSKLHWPGYTNSGLTGNFTVTGWITHSTTWSSGTKDIFDYFVNASNRVRIRYDQGNTRWVITKIVSGTTVTANSSSDTVTSGDHNHLILVQDDTTLHLYVNGVEVASVTATNTMTDGGLIALGCPATGSVDGVDVILDGWRILPDGISSTQALAIYTAELPIKQNGNRVGEPLYLWTEDGDGQLDNCDDSTRNNWGIIGGVGGDLEAETEIQISSAHDNKYFWLGIRPQDDVLAFNPFWFESQLSTVISDATATGGQYSLLSATTSITGSLGSAEQADQDVLFGRYQLLMRVKSSGAALLTTGWSFSASLPFGTRTTPLTNTTFKVLSFGDMFIQYEAEGDNNLATTVIFSLSAVSPVALGLDFALLLPYPFAKITYPTNAIPPGSFTPLVIVGGTAHTRLLESNLLQDVYEYNGSEIAAIPNKYNYLYFLQLDSSEAFTRTHIANVTIYVTPRYLLPGGMVA